MIATSLTNTNKEGQKKTDLRTESQGTKEQKETYASSDNDLSDTLQNVRISRRPKSTHMQSSNAVSQMMSRSKVNIGKTSGFVRIN